jgi:hypothetical protein
MTKRHFIALADAMRDLKPEDPHADGIGWNTATQREARMNQWDDTCKRLALLCAEQNPNFLRGRWLAYIDGECGPNGGKVKAA